MGTSNSTMLVKAFLLASVVGYASCCTPTIMQIINTWVNNNGGGGGGGSETNTTTTTTTKPPPGGNTTTGCDCGKANRVQRIVNGETTEENEYPWQIGLTSSWGSMPYCGGSIIDKKHTLTAAHCTVSDKAKDIYVLVGDHDIMVGNEQKVQVCEKHDHPSYNDGTLEYDFSVLTLCEELTYSEKIQPVCLPSTAGPGAMYESGKAIVSGWGTLSSGGSRPQYLQEVTVNMMTNNKCCSKPYKYGCSDITDQMICASAPGKDSCQGDSGGPLVTDSQNMPGKYTQIGVVSWGYGCADKKYPGVYARVTDQLDWIKNIAQETCSAPTV